jgi:hypothetical protein
MPATRRHYLTNVRFGPRGYSITRKCGCKLMTSDPSQSPTILIAGDVIVDWAQIIEPNRSLKIVPKGGGALFLADLVELALDRDVCSYDRTSLKRSQSPVDHLQPLAHRHSFVQIESCGKRNSKSWDQEDRVPRVKTVAGFSGLPPADRMTAKIDHSADWTILFDADIGPDVGRFRNNPEWWPSSIQNGASTKIIIRTSQPCESPLLNHIVSHYANRTLVITSIEDIRKNGIEISRGLSWESTLVDFFREMKANNRLKKLRECLHVLVRIGLEGVLHFYHVGKDYACQLYYFPSSIEGQFSDQFDGNVLGRSSVFCAVIARALCMNTDTVLPSGTKRDLADAIRSGLSATRKFLEVGYEREFGIKHYVILNPTGNDLSQIFVATAPVDRDLARLRPPDWSFAFDLLEEKLFDLARSIIVDGKTLSGVPMIEYGPLISVDRQEIENYRSIVRILREYLTRDNSIRPLSLAVFGEPGSGKSFGIKAIAENIGGTKSIDFNVSQFAGLADLSTSFHRVREIALKGQVPLVFFDEFDSKLAGNPLGWLKFFLAPMQDGEFLDQGVKYSIGKAILIFAGGTCPTFQKFQDSVLTPAAGAPAASETKGKDFISRLRGYLEILSLNEAQRNSHILRRAVLIRSLVVRFFPNLMDADRKMIIDRGVLSGLLRTKEYRHGARSIEAIFDMSALSGKRAFNRSDLPMREQLNIHADAQSFMDEVVKSSLDNA